MNEKTLGKAASSNQTGGLLERMAGLRADGLADLDETVWIEVIHKMDEVYTDLIDYEVSLEKQNAKLAEAQNFIDGVLAAMSEVLLVCDTQGRIQQANPAATKLTGYDEAALLGKRLVDLLGAEDKNLIAGLITHLPRMNATPEEDTTKEYDLRLIDAKGQLTEPLAVTCSPRRDPKGNIVGGVLTGRRMGELKQAYAALNKAHAELQAAQQQIIQQEKMASLGRLIAGVAHELNNPISFVYGNVFTLEKYRQRLEEYLDALHGGAPATELAALRDTLRIDRLRGDLAPLLDGIKEGAERVSDVVKGLRRLSFAGDGGFSPVNLRECIYTAVDWAVKGQPERVQANTFTRPVIDIDVADHIAVLGQAGQLHQVFVNLLQNALDALCQHESPRIWLVANETATKDMDSPLPDNLTPANTKQEGEAALHQAAHSPAHSPAQKWVSIWIMDNGTGIAEESLGKVFDPFFTTKDVGQGTGLGLWISYTIIRDHGGFLEVTNGFPGRPPDMDTLPPSRNRPEDYGGACFHIGLRMAVTEQQP